MLALRARTAAADARSIVFLSVASAVARTSAAATAERPSSAISPPSSTFIRSRRSAGAGARRLGSGLSLWPQQHQIIAMNHLVTAAIAQDGLDLRRAATHDPGGIPIGVGDDSACHFRSIRT